MAVVGEFDKYSPCWYTLAIMIKTQIIGRLTRDPVSRTTKTGKSVASFTVAVQIGKDADGNARSVFIDCSAWGKAGEIILQYTTKGSQIWVEGTMEVIMYDRQDGSKALNYRINFIQDFQLIGSKPQAEQSGGVSDSEPKLELVPEIDLDDLEKIMPF